MPSTRTGDGSRTGLLLNGGVSDRTGWQQTIAPDASLAAGQHSLLQQCTFVGQYAVDG
jgi:hypothetical protein